MNNSYGLNIDRRAATGRDLRATDVQWEAYVGYSVSVTSKEFGEYPDGKLTVTRTAQLVGIERRYHPAVTGSTEYTTIDLFWATDNITDQRLDTNDLVDVTLWR